jgi:hypothetical protein
MNVLRDTEKAHDKSQQHFMIKKKSEQIGSRSHILQLIKAKYDKPITLTTLTTSFNIVLVAFATEIRQKKERKGIQIESKESNYS